MRQIQLTIVFTNQDGSTTEVRQSAEASRSPGPMGRQRLAHNLFAEFKVAVGEQAAPKHNAAAHRLLDFHGSRTSFEEYFNIKNSQSLWLFLSCTAEVSANELRAVPHSDEPITVVILEHQKFLQVRGAFNAYKTVLAFSNPATRRIYLSSRVFTDFDTALRCITHELGHFATRDGFEDHAELAAERMRWRARQTCQSSVQ